MILAGYLSGSVSYATAVTRLVSGKEIRELGSRNPGTLNVGANLGRGWGVLVGLLDVLKSFLPMLVTNIFLNKQSEPFLFIALIAVGIAAIFGHWKPIFHGFKGGQCVGTAMGVFLFIIPFEFLFAFFFAGMLIYFVVRKFVEKWLRWVPITLLPLVPIVTVVINVLIDIPFFAHISLGGHPWYWMGGIGAVCILMLVINLSYLRKRIKEVNEKK